MKPLLVFLAFLFSNNVLSQNISPDNRIVVLGQASIKIPANRVAFNVQINVIDNENVDKIYQQLKNQETKIFSVLKDLKIPEKHISYSLFSIQRIKDYDTKGWYYLGRQEVFFNLDSVRLYPEVQSKLIKEGFSEFSSEFTSRDLEKYKQQLPEKALQVAKEKAEVLAKAANRKIRRITKITDTEESEPILNNFQYTGAGSLAAAESAPMALSEFKQTVEIFYTIKAFFELK